MKKYTDIIKTASLWDFGDDVPVVATAEASASDRAYAIPISLAQQHLPGKLSNPEGLTKWQDARRLSHDDEFTPSSYLLGKLKHYGFTPLSDTYFKEGLFPFRKKIFRDVKYTLPNARETYYEYRGRGRGHLAKENWDKAREARYEAIENSTLPESTKKEIRKTREDPNFIPSVYMDNKSTNQDSYLILDDIRTPHHTMFPQVGMRSTSYPENNMNIVAPAGAWNNYNWTDENHEKGRYAPVEPEEYLYSPKEHMEAWAEEAVLHPSNKLSGNIDPYNFLDDVIEPADTTDKRPDRIYEVSSAENLRMLSDMKATGWVDPEGNHHEYTDWKDLLDPSKAPAGGNRSLENQLSGMRYIYDSHVEKIEQLKSEVQEIDRKLEYYNTFPGKLLNIFRNRHEKESLEWHKLDYERMIQKEQDILDRFHKWMDSVWPQVAMHRPNTQVTT